MSRFSCLGIIAAGLIAAGCSSSPPKQQTTLGPVDSAASTATVAPGTVPADGTSAATVTVTLKDAQGNALPGQAVTLKASGDAVVKQPGVTNSAGVTTGTLTSTTIGAQTITVSAGGVTLAQSLTVDFVAGTAEKLAFIQQPSQVAAGSVIAPAVQVEVEDAQGNRVTSSSITVTIALSGSAGGTLSGTTSVKASAGVAVFPDLDVDKAGTGYSLIASGAGLSPATSNLFQVTSGAATKLVFEVEPTSTRAGSAISPSVVVAAEDASGNLVTSATGTVTLSLASNPGGDTLGGNTSQALVGGKATFSDLTLTHAASGYSLLAQAGSGFSSAASTPFDVTAGPVAKMAFLQEPSNAVSGAVLVPAVEVVMEDSSGNVVTNASGSVTLALVSNPSGGTLSGTKTQSLVQGVATFGDLSIDKTGTGYALGASSGSLPALTSATFDITPGQANALVFTQEPVGSTAGSALSAVEVAVEDANGNVVSSASMPITVAFQNNPSGGVLAGTKTVNAVSGVATFSNLEIDRAASGYTLEVLATGLVSGTSTPFDVSPAAASKLVFALNPSDALAGRAITPPVQVAVQDAYGNDVTSSNATVTVALAGGTAGATLSGTKSQAVNQGVAVFSNLSVDKTGTGFSLTASASGLPSATSASFNVSPDVATQLAVQAQPADAAAGSPVGTVKVAVEDAQGNVVTSSSASISVTLSGGSAGATLSGTTLVAATGGIATFSNLTVDHAGTGYQLGVDSAGLTGTTTDAFDITPGAANRLVFTTQPSTVVAGAAISPAVQVAIKDAYGNTVTSSSATVTVALGTNPSGGTLLGTTSAAASGGVATFSDLKLQKTGTGYTLTASSNGLSGSTSSAFDVTAGAPSQMVFTQQPTNVMATHAISPAVRVTLEDAYGNVATGSTATVSVALTGGTAGAVLSGTKSVSAMAGVAGFADLSVDEAGTGYALVASSGTLSNVTSASFDVAPNTPTKLVVTQQPTNSVAGTPISAIEVAMEDAQGNVVTTASGTVDLSIDAGPAGATLSGTTSATVVNGVATFSNVAIDQAGTGYTLQATSGALTPAVTSPFDVSAASAAQIAFLQQPVSAENDQILSPVEVAVEDAYGNVVTTDTRGVSLALHGGDASATLSGILAVQASSGIASFTDLSVDKTGTGYYLTAQASGVSTINSDAFDITPAPIVGMAIHHYYSGSGSSAIETDVPEDFSSATLTAYVPLSDGGFDVYHGGGDSDGGFYIDGVPTTEYELQWGGQYFASTTRTWDMSTDFEGRADGVPADPNAELDVHVTGANPTLSYSFFTIHSFDSPNDYWFTKPGYATFDESIYFSNMAGGYDHLVQNGDLLLFTQSTSDVAQSNIPDGGVAYTAISNEYSTDTLNMINGQSVSVSASLSPLQRDMTLSRTFDFPSMANDYNLGVDGGYPIATDVEVDTAPNAHDFYDVTVPLFGMNDTSSVILPEETLSFNYGVLDPAWGMSAKIGMTFRVQYDMSHYVTASSFFYEPLSDLSNPVEPVLGPVRQIEINGALANQMIAGVGETPLVSWMSPSLGTPNGFRVCILQYYSSVGEYLWTNNAIYTTGYSVRIPPGLLQSGNSYIFEVDSMYSGSADYSRSPLRSGANFALTAALTGRVTP